MKSEAQGAIPPQHQDVQPGRQAPMRPPPESDAEHYRGSGKLEGRLAIVTGGDSGIGRAVSIAFAKEGADVAVLYLDEHEDARHTRARIEAAGRRCFLLAGDLGEEAHARRAVTAVMEAFGRQHPRIDVLVNNAAEQHPQEELAEISRAQLEQTFRTNLFAIFDLTRYALEHMGEGGCIVNTASVTAYRGSAHLLDYSASKGAIVSFTRSLAQQLIERGIRVNAVAPGPVWTPLIPSTASDEEVARFGSKSPFGRPAQPDEIAPCFVFLGSEDSRYMSGQVLHPNGGEIING